MENNPLIFKVGKRYKDIFDLYIHKGEPTPFTIGTLVTFGFCFLVLIVATFFQFNFSGSWLPFIKNESVQQIAYTPQIPAMLFVIYILGRNYSILLFALYLAIGFFVWPIFAFGGGLGYAQNYLFGYFLGFIVAIFTSSLILKKSLKIPYRLLSAFVGVLSIHATGFIYCLILAIFKIIDFSLIAPIVKAISGERILYDILFSLILFLTIPYIKNVFWTCMKPKADDNKKSRRSRHKRQSNS